MGEAFHQLRTTVRDSKSGQVVCSSEVWRAIAALTDVHASGECLHGDSSNWLVRSCELQQHHPHLEEQKDDTDTASHSTTFSAATDFSTSIAYSSFSSSPPAFDWRSASLNAIDSFLMPALLSRLLPDLPTPSHWLGESRRVTVLFASLPLPENCTTVFAPSMVSPSTATRSHQPTFHSLVTTPSPLPLLSSSRILLCLLIRPSLRGCLLSIHLLVCCNRSYFANGGQIRQLVVDDKGCVLVACFGLPPGSNEDFAARAVTAAVVLRDRVKQEDSEAAESIKVGLATGRVWCGAVGSEARREYAMVGGVVNLAARIMHHSLTKQRHVLCDEETAMECGERVNFQCLPRVAVKGKEQLIDVYEPLSTAQMILKSVSAAAPEEQLSSSKSTTPTHAYKMFSPISPSSHETTRAQTLDSIEVLVSQRQAVVVLLEGGAGQGKVSATLAYHSTQQST